MAITKLMHMKECKSFPPEHLKNAIDYILDVSNDGKKTEYGLWVGGNVGVDADVVYKKFVETKKVWGKEHERQGYHFVISFSPNETNESTCYDVLNSFCEEYLKDDYEYVFAVHNDKEHVHGHIIFNSVNRIDGHKYRYEKGDWEKYIQPVTDEITKRFGLSPLVFSEDRVGKKYIEWANNKIEKVNWTNIIRSDVDLAIKNSSNMEEFFLFLKDLGYSIRSGTTQRTGKKETYLTFSFTDENGKTHRKRSYNLLAGTDEYSLENIRKKIQDKSKMKEPHYETVVLLLEGKAKFYLGMKSQMSGYKTYNRLYQAVSYYKLPNPFAIPSYQVRRDMIRIDKLIEECAYLKKYPPKNVSELKQRFENLDENLKTQYIKRNALRKEESEFKKHIPQEIIYRYMKLKKELLLMDAEDEKWEQTDDEIKEIEKNLPSAFVLNIEEMIRCEYKIEFLKNEKRILGRVINSEGGEENTNIFTKIPQTRIPK